MICGTPCNAQRPKDHRPCNRSLIFSVDTIFSYDALISVLVGKKIKEMSEAPALKCELGASAIQIFFNFASSENSAS